MARNRNRKTKNRNINNNRDVLGVALIVISAFLLLCIVIKPILGIFSEAIFGVMLGTFGIASYPALLAVLILGIFVLKGKTISASLKTRLCLGFGIAFLLIILQLATTHSFLNYGFTDYIDATYSAKYSAGGILVGLVAYGLSSLITEIACYVIFSIAFVIDIAIMTSVISNIKLWSSRRKSAVKPEPEPSPVPQEARRVIDATPAPGLFTGMIERSEPETESGRATSLPPRTARTSSYPDTDIFDDEEDERTRSAAHYKLYGDSEEIRRQAAESFRSDRQPEPEPAPEPEPEPAPEPKTETAFMEPSERVASDVERPRRVDYDGTPGNLNALYFPPEKTFQFNDEGIEVFEDPPRRPEAPGFDVEEPPAGPSFGVPKSHPLPHVEPIIDASQPIEPTQSLSAEERFMRTFGGQTQFQPTPEPEPAPEPTKIPPLETDRFKAEEIFDASDALDLFSATQNGEPPEQEEILDASVPYEPELQGQPDIEEILPDVPMDNGILDGSLVITDEPAVDMSETGFDNGDVFTGEDMSGMYVSADEEQPVAPTPKQPKPKKSANAPLENQRSIEEVLREKAEESVVAQDTKRYKQYNYTPPPFDLLKIYEHVESAQDELQTNAQTLEDIVSRFLKTQVHVINIVPGPQVTRYELEVPSGTSVKAIESHCADIAYELAAVSGVRVEAPIPGKRAVGIEVPNRHKAIVGLREVVDSQLFTRHKSRMVFSVGKDVGGELVVCDLEKIPHLLIAGQTGSGKSAGLNSLIVSLLYKASPDDLRFILIDPKRVEFSKFRGMPHLLFEKTITEPNEALNALKWADTEMNRRYTVLQRHSCSKLAEYNDLPDVKSGKLGKLPHIVIIIDELANLMQSAVSGEIESKISSIAALARAAGIHLIVATQRPSADVITGTIKANLTSRIAFKVPDAMNSRIIIDVVGAESLSGDGDMLFYPNDASAPRRVQGSYVTGEEVLSVVGYIKDNYETDFDEDAEKFVSGGASSSGGGAGGASSDLDPLAESIMAYAIKAKQITVSIIQRRFSIGYARAARIIDTMEERGFVGPSTGNSKPRDVLMTPEKYKEVFGHDLDNA